MLRKLLHALGIRKPTKAPLHLPTIDRADISHLLRTEHDLPHLDWGAAESWARTQTSQNPAALRRAIAAAWLDELRDALKDDHRRWRHATVEGLGPLDDNLAIRAAKGADRAIEIITDSLQRLRGNAPIPLVAIIALRKTDDYYSFIAPYYPDEGEFGTSGGVYLNEGGFALPMIVLPMTAKWAVEQTLAHELTHHALRGKRLPLWAEEGLTQMMEERVTGHSNFQLNQEMLDRHQNRWGEDDDALERFFSGESFHSPHDDEQELAYHLAQFLVRGLLEQRPDQFFAFAAACAKQRPEDAATEHLGETPHDIARRVLRLDPIAD
jgi:hypothetical protein